MSNIDNYSAIPRNAIIACSFSCFAQQNKMCCPASKQLNPLNLRFKVPWHIKHEILLCLNAILGVLVVH